MIWIFATLDVLDVRRWPFGVFVGSQSGDHTTMTDDLVCAMCVSVC